MTPQIATRPMNSTSREASATTKQIKTGLRQGERFAKMSPTNEPKRTVRRALPKNSNPPPKIDYFRILCTRLGHHGAPCLARF